MCDRNLIETFLSFLKNNRKTAHNTLSAYERDLSFFADYLDVKGIDFNNVDSNVVSEYKKVLENNGKSVATVSRYMSALRSFYKFLVVSSYIDVNPAVKVKNDKTEKKFFEVLTEEEIDRLLSQPDSKDFKGMRDRAMLEILYATGMKVSELISLDLSDVNLKLGCVKCRSSKDSAKNRVILLYPDAVKLVGEYILKSRPYFIVNTDETSLFVNINGERMTRQGFWKILKSYAEKADISKSITPHTLRHSFATHLLENGADINDIKNILGHSDISSTNVYNDFIKSKINNSYLRYNHRAK